MKKRRQTSLIVGVSLTPELVAKLDREVEKATPKGEAPNRSAFLRDLVRQHLSKEGAT